MIINRGTEGTRRRVARTFLRPGPMRQEDSSRNQSEGSPLIEIIPVE